MSNSLDFVPVAERLVVLRRLLRSGGIPASLGPRVQRVTDALAQGDCTKAVRRLAYLDRTLDDLARPALQLFASAGYRLRSTQESIRRSQDYVFEGEARRIFIIPNLTELQRTAERLRRIFDLKV